MDCKTAPAPFSLHAEQPRQPKKPAKQKREKLGSPAQQQKDRAAERYANFLATHRTASTDETLFRHSNWKDKRARVLAALKHAGTGANAIDAFQQCGADCTVEYCKEEKKYRLRAQYCHCRHCEPCARAKGNLLTANLRKRLETQADGRYRFITLTLRHRDDNLRPQIERLYQSFRALRASKLWKGSQRGGCAILEVKWDPDTGLWHPHLHVISEGDFIHQADLSNAWLKITGDSSIVDIRALSAGKDAAHYVAKYVSKGTNNEVWWNDSAAVEWIHATKGVRTAATFGTWRGFALLDHLPDAGTWTRIGSLDQIYSHAREGQVYAVRLLDTLAKELQYDPHKKRTKKGKPPA